MGSAPENGAGADAFVSTADSDVFTNANTITKWLLSQPSESRLQIAQGIYDKLLQDASQSRQHHGNGQACVKLCSFVQQCAKSSDESLKQWAFTETLSMKLFHFYLEWYEHDPHRALRLVLDVLVMSAAQNPNPETGRLIKDNVLETLVAIVTRKSPRLLTKSGLQCFDHFFTKQAIEFGDVTRKYRKVEPLLADSPSLVLWRSFVFHLLSWMELSYVAPLAGKCIVHIFRGLQTSKSTNSDPGVADFTVELWLGWLQDGLSKHPEVLEDIRNYVLVPIFKTDRPSALALLRAFNRADALTTVEHSPPDQSFLLQLAALELGKKNGLVEDPSGSDDTHQSPNSIVLRETVLEGFLSHHILSVRSSAFSLLVSSQATTRPFSPIAFSLLKNHLASFHADYDAKFRNEVLGLTKGLVGRIKNVITVSQRSLLGSVGRENQEPAAKKKYGPEAAIKDDAEAEEVLASHEAFLKWYLNFLKGELLPTASYQRHITALKAAILVVKVGKHAAASDNLDLEAAELISSDSTWIRLLLDLMLDPFDDVRETSATLLGLFPQSIVEAPTSAENGPASLLETLQEFCLRARALADRTGRADHGDGAARSQGLLCKWLSNQEARINLVSSVLQGLQEKIARAEKDLGHAALDNPVHGDFAAISYIWHVLTNEKYSSQQLETIHTVHRRILSCSKRIWAAVKHVLCDDSPEGHLPEEMEEIEGLDTKDLLSYSFRAVHESSNLLRLTVGTLRLEVADGVPFPPLDVFKDVGYMTFEQLASLRHRGAFSTVSLTFTTCCQLTQRLPAVFPGTAGSGNLLREWYQGAMVCIETQASTTRRSAGIPSLIAAILSANAESPSFEEVFYVLEEISKKPARTAETDGSNLPQVHALNCLRGVFRSSLLSKKAESYLAVNLQLAANSLKSEIWAIRNCGLLLLRSLIDCLLGTGESKATMESGWDGHSVRISYNKYPTLPGVILGLLQSADKTLDDISTSAAEAVFPALDIIRRAGPPDEHRQELRRRIEGYLGSRIWHVREIAARTLCSFLLQADWASELVRLLSQGEVKANRFHGILLATRFVIERKADLGCHAEFDSPPLASLLEKIAERVAPFEGCPEIQAAHLEVVNLLESFKSQNINDSSSGTVTSSAIEYSVSSALLDIQTAEKSVRGHAVAGNIDGLRTYLVGTLGKDINTGCRMLEVLTSIWERAQGPGSQAGLCNMYAEVCIHVPSPEARAQALLNFGASMADILGRQAYAELPSFECLQALWDSLSKGEINPTLSCAIISTSGTLLAAIVSPSPSGVSQLQQEQWMRSWGAMIADSLDINNTFDTRHAAATALSSFFLGSPEHDWDSKYLPALLALYDSLVDDDDEVREVAANAAAGVLGTHMVAPTAADSLVEWLGQHFAGQDEFRGHLICRMTGGAPLAGTKEGGVVQLVPAEEQLARAMDIDDSLFAAEEQNLFIDEVREARRWRCVLSTLNPVKGPWFGSLAEWAELGLRRLLQLAERDDGPLGWTSDQHVFALCARIVLCAAAIAETARPEAGVVVGLLAEFREVGKGKRVHGSLLEMGVSTSEGLV